MPDIDIDFANRDQILTMLQHRVATLDGVKKHNSGIYPTEIPHNSLTNHATIDYKTAESRGYYKIDFLNVNIYKGVKDEQHLVELLNQEPIWDLFEHKDFVDQVFHISGHTAIMAKLKPKSIEQLAAVLAIIRPAKRYLADCSWDQINNEVWVKPLNDQYFFKKSHGIAYAMTVIVHANLLINQLRSSS
jgi:DNA polymerase III alpha subunit